MYLAEHSLRGAKGERGLRYLDAGLTHLESNYLNDGAVRIADRALTPPGLVAGGERCLLLLRKAGRLDVVGRRDAQHKALSEALALADSAGDPGLRAKARTEMGRYLLAVSRLNDAKSAFGESLALAREIGNRRVEAAAISNLGVSFASLGRFSEAREHLEWGLALAREIGDQQCEPTPR